MIEHGTQKRSRGRGRLFQRGGVWWIAYYHRGQEIRESAKTPSQKKAEKLLDQRLRKAGTPDFIGPVADRLTFDDVAQMYLDDFRVNGKRSLRDATRNVETLRGMFGTSKVLDITTDTITRYIASRLEAGRQPATVNRELAALKRMFTLAIRAGKLANRPHVPLLSEEGNARSGFLEPADFAVLRDALPPWLAGAVTFAYLTGWRRREVATLEWRDVSLGAQEIRLRSA
jgi:integrase